MASDPTARWLERVFEALADPLRVRILSLVADREMCVGYLVEVLRTLQPLVSRQLAYLRRTGLVEARRDGKWIHYRLRQPENMAAVSVLSEALRQFKRVRQNQIDVARLAACSERRVGKLKDAPLPQRIGR